MKNLTKTILAMLAVGFVSCALFSQQAQATSINGMINFAGEVQFDTNFANATRVVTWFDVFHNAGFSSVTGGTGDFAAIAPGTSATMAQPWIFNPSTPTPGLWSVGGFTFDLLTSTVVTHNAQFLTVTGTGIASGNGFEPTSMEWSFSTQNLGGTQFSFSATGVAGAVPDGGITVMLLGAALGALGMARRFLMS